MGVYIANWAFQQMMADKKPFSEKAMLPVLDWCYNKVLSEGGAMSAYKLADDYLKKEGNDPKKVAKELVKWQKGKGFASGFMTGLGGIITLPVAIPVNIVSVLLVQIRMIAAIAHLGGYDLKSDQVKTFVYVCLVGSAASDIIKNTGIRLGNKIAYAQVSRISGETLLKINQKIGFRLFTKFGQKGIVNFGKMIPIAGGVIGGSVDYWMTKKNRRSSNRNIS